jgi:phage baseplate assembly protein W
VVNQQKENSFLGSGWSFPVSFSAGNFLLNQSSYVDNINESINIILLTKNGERCFEPQFGSGLNQFYFRTMDGTLITEMKDAINAALLLNEPRITVTDVSVEFTDIPCGIVSLNIAYAYNLTNTRHNYVFPFHLKEGTNLIKSK